MESPESNRVELPRPKGIRRGVQCPECGAREGLAVTRTRRDELGIWRVRRCSACRATFTTCEQ
ncbi:MAG: hypothetical protein JW809_19440 [Pirellulales bacterium]|nr:hypothetical protein [Pirellulales bacterium]